MRRSRRASGFSMLIAITCIAFVGVAITLIARVVTQDARRTGRELVEAQQRQLLLAALPMTAAALDGDSLTLGTLATPAEADATLRVDRIERPSPDRVIVTTAVLAESSTLAQRATYDHVGRRWRLAGAEIVR